MDERIEKVGIVVNELKAQMFGESVDIADVMSAEGIRCKKVPYGHRKELLGDWSDWDEFVPGSAWGEPDGHEFFRVKVTVPESFYGKEVFFFMSTGADDIWNTDNPQMLVYVNGVRRSGMDMNHNSISIYSRNDWENSADRTIDIAIYAYSNLSQNGNLLNMELAALDEAAKDTFFDMSVPFDAAKAMLGLDSRKNAIDLLSDKEAVKSVKPVDSEHADQILCELTRACELLERGRACDGERVVYSEEALKEASALLHENLYGAESDVTVASVGHTHIDVAWKWPVRQTREKVIRSYSTVMELMKRYPEYLFMASTPQMYEFVREDEPELFEEIVKRAKEGRFEPEGAMWLEADCNLTSGESLVRQILYGKRYFKDTFGVDSDILWLPDVFGYSGAMPQILKKSGIRAFVTTKLAWNDTNRMPNDLFLWKGIDGSVIPTYIITTCDLPKADQVMNEGGILNYTYNGRQDASQIMGTWRAFREKSVTNEVLTCYGFGDGGGGPTWEMLENDRRLREGIPGCPKTKQMTVSEFMDGLLSKVENNTEVPVWEDELYLEFHRGTYTSMGKNKRYNRQLEALLKEAEVVRTIAYVKCALPYPRKEMMDVWKTLMLNQFHDILPGSSIEEVYVDSEKDYKKAIDIVKSLIDEGFNAVAKLELNSLEALESAGDFRKKTEDTNKSVGESGEIEVLRDNDGLKVTNPYYEISFDKNAEIISLYDREANREVRDKKGSPLNRLIAFKDAPQEYDAWNIDADFEDESWDIVDADSIDIRYLAGDSDQAKELKESSGAQISGVSKVILTVKRRFRSSEITQEIVISADSRAIEIHTVADWHEHQILLKAAFPVDIDSKKITCEIQYGDIKRNLTRENSWDKAKFECCAHRWMDISEEKGSGFGVAVLNDCKYGYDAKEKLMRLTLIKSGIFPNPNADQGKHEFTYSLYPHMGDHRAGHVIEEAQKLNRRSLEYMPEEADFVSDALERSIIDIETSGVYVGAIKLAEDSDDVVIRLYEGHGKGKKVKARLFADSEVVPKAVCVCDLLEKSCLEGAIEYDSSTKEISYEMKPYEIQTFIVRF